MTRAGTQTLLASDAFRQACLPKEEFGLFRWIAVASVAVASACAPTSSEVSRRGVAAPVPEAVGIFRFICETRNPEERLIFPFRLVDDASKTYRHTDFDMAFRVDSGCAMRVRNSEKPSETSNGEQRVLYASGEDFESRMSSAIPKARVENVGDGYFLVSLPKKRT